MSEKQIGYVFYDYVIMGKLGRKSPARIFVARNKKNDSLYVIKKVNTLEGMPESTLKEIGVIRKVQHPNIVRFYQVFLMHDYCYIVFEFLKMNLEEFIKNHEISKHLLQSFMFQLLQGTLYCHRCTVVHRDIRPGNIFVDHDMKVVKIGNFEKCSKITIRPSPKRSPSAVTLNYRSPELILQCEYSCAIDIWALGCVFAEMVIKKPPFEVDCQIDLFNSWFSQLGIPAKKHFPLLSETIDLDKFKIKMNSTTDRIDILEECVDPLCFDLIKKMFTYNPALRIDGTDALLHEYFVNFDRSIVPAIDEELRGVIYIHDLE